MDASVTIDYVKYKHATLLNYHTTFGQIMFSKMSKHPCGVSIAEVERCHENVVVEGVSHIYRSNILLFEQCEHLVHIEVAR